MSKGKIKMKATGILDATVATIDAVKAFRNPNATTEQKSALSLMRRLRQTMVFVRTTPAVI